MNSFVTWTKGLKERIREAEKENQMPDKKYICLSDGSTFTEDELHQCSCGKYSCPTCGGEVSTIKEYEEAMLINSRES